VLEESAGLAEAESGEVDVYVAVETNSEKCYFGITNDFGRRVLEHNPANGPGRFRMIERVKLSLTRNDARIVEQRLIQKYGGAISEEGSLANKINSVAKGSGLWQTSVAVNAALTDVFTVLDLLNSVYDLPCVP
ncbi:MAG TPA: hypothetical protein VGE98_06225, partial [Thermoanaerobaculia bacterium]